MRRLARTYRDAGIPVNCICPGRIRNDMAVAFDPPPPTLVGAAHPADVAYAAVYFAADESAWVTGQVLEVEGGGGLGGAGATGGMAAAMCRKMTGATQRGG